MKAQEHLDAAAGLVGGDRARQHGDVRSLHEMVAALWNAYLTCEGSPVRIIDCDVLVMMALLKIARLRMTNARDSAVDGAGYLALGYEIGLD